MKIFRLLYSIFIEAVFPLSPAEKELFSYTPAKAYEILPKAPLTPKLTDDTGIGGFHSTIGVFAYKDPRVYRLVWNIKYKKSESAVKIAGYALRKVISATLFSYEISNVLPIVILPMPVTKRRRNERGYNQCELITKEISRYVGTEVRILFENNLLERVHHTSHQKNKDRRGRLELEKGIFKVNMKELEQLQEKMTKNINSGYLIRDIPFIIIDDVITTGATIKEAMETMKNAGLRNVRAVALAH